MRSFVRFSRRVNESFRQNGIHLKSRHTSFTSICVGLCVSSEFHAWSISSISGNRVMSKYNVNEEYDMENRTEVTLTGFSSNAVDDILRSNNNESNALNGNPGGAHAITKDAKIVNLEGESYHYFYYYILILYIFISYLKYSFSIQSFWKNI